MVSSFPQGVFLGFSIAAPVGPIGVLVLKQSLRSGVKAGLFSGLGAALADLIYGALAIAGVRLAAGLERQVAILGGTFLLWLAWKTWRETPNDLASLPVTAGPGDLFTNLRPHALESHDDLVVRLAGGKCRRILPALVCGRRILGLHALVDHSQFSI
jgi:LysE type translocator